MICVCYFVEGETQLSLNGTILKTDTSSTKLIFVDGLNTIRIGNWWSYYTKNTMASIEFYLKPFTSNDIMVAMEKSRTLAFDEGNCTSN